MSQIDDSDIIDPPKPMKWSKAMWAKLKESNLSHYRELESKDNPYQPTASQTKGKK